MIAGFNSRTHAGCDFKFFGGDFVKVAVSIHAPTRGATYAGIASCPALLAFQFTHPRGVRRTLLGFLIINELSNIICEVNNFIPNFKYIFQYY